MRRDHSEAPWRYDSDGPMITDANDEVIALFFLDERVGPSEEFPSAAADGPLMAAAPEMLAALQQVQAAVCSYLCPSIWRAGAEQPHSSYCVNIRAAIAKARGEADV